MGKLNSCFSMVEDWSASVFLVTGFVLMLYEVVMRYVFDSPTSWVNEVSTVSVVWGIFFGLSAALRDHHHIHVDILYVKLSQKLQIIVDYVANLVGAAFCLFFAYNGTLLVIQNVASGQVSTETGVPLWVYYAVLPVSGVMFFLRFIDNITKIRKNASVKQLQQEGQHGNNPAF